MRKNALWTLAWTVIITAGIAVLYAGLALFGNLKPVTAVPCGFWIQTFYNHGAMESAQYFHPNISRWWDLLIFAGLALILLPRFRWQLYYPPSEEYCMATVVLIAVWGLSLCMNFLGLAIDLGFQQTVNLSFIATWHWYVMMWAIIPLALTTMIGFIGGVHRALNEPWLKDDSASCVRSNGSRRPVLRGCRDHQDDQWHRPRRKKPLHLY